MTPGRPGGETFRDRPRPPFRRRRNKPNRTITPSQKATCEPESSWRRLACLPSRSTDQTNPTTATGRPITRGETKPISLRRTKPISLRRTKPISLRRTKPTSLRRTKPISSRRTKPISLRRTKPNPSRRTKPTVRIAPSLSSVEPTPAVFMVQGDSIAFSGAFEPPISKGARSDPKDFPDLGAEVVDDLLGDPARRRSGERARDVALQGGPDLGVDLGLERRPERPRGVVGGRVAGVCGPPQPRE